MEKDLLRYWLALLRLPGFGPVKLSRLIQNNKDISWLFQHPLNPSLSHLPEDAKQYLKKPDWSSVDNDLNWLKQENCYFIPITSDDYPALLREIPDPPIGLFVQGDISLLAHPQIAIVGSRNPTAAGLETATAFARHLGQAGLCITSGLAMGIDGCAHKGALSANAMTIAVTGTGLDRVYPASHKGLMQQIVATGCMVSEYPPGTTAMPGNFPRRNRIISGLSVGTLVVEAALRSGSLITAKQALEQGREVFAIPGSIHNPLARGCHSLIRQGAKLVETAEDVIEELGALLASLSSENPILVNDSPTQYSPKLTKSYDTDYLKLLESMGYDPASTNQLIERTGFTAETVSSMLLRLELEEEISSNPGGYFTRTHNID